MGYYMVSLKKGETSERDKAQPDSSVRNFSLAASCSILIVDPLMLSCHQHDLESDTNRLKVIYIEMTVVRLKLF